MLGDAGRCIQVMNYSSRDDSMGKKGYVAGARIVASSNDEGKAVLVVPPAPRFARKSASSLPNLPAFPGTHIRVVGENLRACSRRVLARVIRIRLVLAFHLSSTVLMTYVLSMKL